ncbi:hypothetical protein CVT25_004860 [Psilocybe cyanescens]|uniref:Uncharacterized protein n=1 Tax=Psilocybe cyanescens TaxID=93625 RepID=A0A409XGN0_PSICY|nr:hypothetical protein CVT25_004860 [Psilocybe cyanescens]
MTGVDMDGYEDDTTDSEDDHDLHTATQREINDINFDSEFEDLPLWNNIADVSLPPLLHPTSVSASGPHHQQFLTVQTVQTQVVTTFSMPSRGNVSLMVGTPVIKSAMKSNSVTPTSVMKNSLYRHNYQTPDHRKAHRWSVSFSDRKWEGPIQGIAASGGGPQSTWSKRIADMMNALEDSAGLIGRVKNSLDLDEDNSPSKVSSSGQPEELQPLGSRQQRANATSNSSKNISSASAASATSPRPLSIATPPVPATYRPLSVPSTSRISAPHPSGHRTLLPVGSAYINHLCPSLHDSHSFSSLDKHLSALHGEVNVGKDGLGVGEEGEPEELLALDPKEWKKLHPNKKDAMTTTVPSSLFLAGMNQNTNNNAFFKYIPKDHEVLNNPEKLCEFDSVDLVFLELKEDMPTVAQIKSKDLKSQLLLLSNDYCLQSTVITPLFISCHYVHPDLVNFEPFERPASSAAPADCSASENPFLLNMPVASDIIYNSEACTVQYAINPNVNQKQLQPGGGGGGNPVNSKCS